MSDGKESEVAEISDADQLSAQPALSGTLPGAQLAPAAPH